MLQRHSNVTDFSYRKHVCIGSNMHALENCFVLKEARTLVAQILPVVAIFFFT